MKKYRKKNLSPKQSPSEGQPQHYQPRGPKKKYVPFNLVLLPDPTPSPRTAVERALARPLFDHERSNKGEKDDERPGEDNGEYRHPARGSPTEEQD